MSVPAEMRDLFDRYCTPQTPETRDGDRKLAGQSARRPVRVESDGLEVQTYAWGDGPAVLLVHGWGSRATHFAALIRSLTGAGLRCVAFDAPAHGESPGARTNMPQVIRCMREVAAAYGPLAGVVGYSFGGMAAALAHAETPQPGRPLEAPALALISAPATLETMTRRFLTGIGEPLRHLAPMHRVLTEIHGHDPADYDVVRVAARLPSRLLIVHDHDDAEVPVSDAERLAAARPFAEVLVTERLGHARMLFARPVIATVTRFLTAAD